MTTGDCFILMRFEERRTNDPLFDKRCKGVKTKCLSCSISNPYKSTTNPNKCSKFVRNSTFSCYTIDVAITRHHSLSTFVYYHLLEW